MGLSDNSRTARFMKCGNYLPSRINSKNINGSSSGMSKGFPGEKMIVT